MLQLLDKVDAQSATVTIKSGQTATYGALTIAVRACEVSAPDAKPDATAFLDISDSHPDLPSFHGWMLKSDPLRLDAATPDLRRAGAGLPALMAAPARPVAAVAPLASAPPLPPIERAALLLDFDGTLVDIAPTPDSVVVPADLAATLRALRLA